MIIADTNVVSEILRDSPDPRVLARVEALTAGRLTICSLTVFEIERGITRLPPGRRAEDLARRWSVIVRRFADEVIPLDAHAAQEAATILARAESRGRPMSMADAQIAGCCLASGAVLATRNTSDFDGVEGLRLVNPFEQRG